MIKPCTNSHSKVNTMASTKPNSQTNKRSRTLALFCSTKNVLKLQESLALKHRN